MGVAALILASQFYVGPFGHILLQQRSFYGVYRVGDDTGMNCRVLFHGSTAHGIQSLNPNHACEPLAYYSRTGPIGEVFGAFPDSPVETQVAVIGLGAGAMACYQRPDRSFTFYEIDPTVLRIAQNRRYFSLLSGCGSTPRVILGDARLSLRTAAPHAYGMILLDAFSGDSIPVHLLTREALALYLEKLIPDGILAYHISNRYVELHGVLAGLAQDAALSCLMSDEPPLTEDERRSGKFASWWVVMARQRDDLKPLVGARHWRECHAASGSRVWTDDFSNVVSILRFR